MTATKVEKHNKLIYINSPGVDLCFPYPAVVCIKRVDKEILLWIGDRTLVVECMDIDDAIHTYKSILSVTNLLPDSAINSALTV